MDLHQYLDAVRKYWWAILVPTLLAGLLGLYSASQSDASYRASVTFFVATRGDASTTAAVQGDQFATRRVNSYVALATTDRLAQLIVDDSGVGLSAGQVRSMIGASGDLDTVLLTVSITSASRDLALQLGESLATTFVELVDEVENGSQSTTGSVNLEVVSGPNVGEVPSRPLLGAATRGLMGLLLGVGLAVLLQLRDHAVRSQDDLDALGLGPILGSIPIDRRERSSVALYVEDRMQPVTAESFRHLRTSLQFLDVDRTAQVIVVSSSVPEEGKSFVSRNLALAMAATNLRVLLVEGDLRRPTLSEAFDVERVPGLSDVLAGRAPLERALRSWGSKGLTILPSGYLPPNPSELLGSGAAQNLIQDLRAQFDVVVIDTPPLLPVTDGAVVAAHADGVLLVVRAGKTSRHQVAVSAQRLGLVGARYLGAVMNMVTEAPTGTYTSYERRGETGKPSPEASVSAENDPFDPRLLDSALHDPGPLPPGPSRAVQSGARPPVAQRALPRDPDPQAGGADPADADSEAPRPPTRQAAAPPQDVRTSSTGPSTDTRESEAPHHDPGAATTQVGAPLHAPRPSADASAAPRVSAPRKGAGKRRGKGIPQQRYANQDGRQVPSGQSAARPANPVDSGSAERPPRDGDQGPHEEPGAPATE